MQSTEERQGCVLERRHRDEILQSDLTSNNVLYLHECTNRVPFFAHQALPVCVSVTHVVSQSALSSHIVVG